MSDQAIRKTDADDMMGMMVMMIPGTIISSASFLPSLFCLVVQDTYKKGKSCTGKQIPINHFDQNSKMFNTLEMFIDADFRHWAEGW
jgi:hypothetical protein